jgi:hypothetical protein
MLLREELFNLGDDLGYLYVREVLPADLAYLPRQNRSPNGGWKGAG